LANARSPVLVEHCLRSNAGLFYADRDEFVECLKLLVGSPAVAAALGQNGRDYVRHNFRWDGVLGKDERILARGRGRRGSKPAIAMAALQDCRMPGLQNWRIARLREPERAISPRRRRPSKASLSGPPPAEPPAADRCRARRGTRAVDAA